MTLGKYLFLMLIGTIFCLCALSLVVFFINPETAGAFGIIIFFLSTFFAIVGGASIIGFLIRYFLNPKQFSHIQVSDSFRQSIWIALLVVISMYLMSQGIARWWNLLLLILILASLEMFCVSMKKNNI
jgi:hypothetical protein